MATWLSVLAVQGCAGAGPSPDDAIPFFDVVRGWPVLAEGTLLGEVTGVAVDAHNHVFVVHTGRRTGDDPLSDDPIPVPTVLRFDGDTGVLQDSWGADHFLLPHGLAVDAQQNVWLADIWSHQVFKFTHEGVPLLTLGERGVPGADTAHFAGPNDVAPAPDGTVYISDGYGNTRVLRLAADGSFIAAGVLPGGPAQPLPHGITRGADGRVYLADRANARVVVFDAGLTTADVWSGGDLGRPWGLEVAPDGVLYVADAGDPAFLPPYRGRIVMLSLAGTVLQTWGTFGRYDGQLAWPHDVAIGADGAVYVGEVYLGSRVQKFVRRP